MSDACKVFVCSVDESSEKYIKGILERYGLKVILENMPGGNVQVYVRPSADSTNIDVLYMVINALVLNVV